MVLALFSNMAYDTGGAPAHGRGARGGPPRPALHGVQPSRHRRPLALPPSSPTDVRSPQLPPRHHRIRESSMSSIGTHRRPGRRQRLRRRHPRVPPGRRRRRGRGPGARAMAGGRGLRPRLPARLVLHPGVRLHRRRRDERAGRQLRRRRQRRLLRRHAARAALRRSSGTAASAGGCGRPSINRDTLDPWYDRVAEAMPVPQQGWDDVTLPRRAVGGRVRPRGPHRQPGTGRRRQRPVHQLQLDDGRLPVRREAVAAAELPAGRRRPGRPDPAAARGAVDLPHRRRRLPRALQGGRRRGLPRAHRRRGRSRRRSSCWPRVPAPLR